MDHLTTLPRELKAMAFKYLLPDMHIKVQRKQTYTNPGNQYHVAVTNHADWKEIIKLRLVSKRIYKQFHRALMVAQTEGEVRLIMDMAQHPRNPARRMPNYLLGVEAPSLMLGTFWELEVKCPYVADNRILSTHPSTAIVLQEVSVTHRLFRPGSPSAPLPGHNDTIKSIDWLEHYLDAPAENNLNFMYAASDNIEWAISHPLVAQGTIPTPYLTPLSSKGLYDLGILFANKAAPCADAREATLYPNHPPRFGIGDHKLNVQWLRWAKP